MNLFLYWKSLPEVKTKNIWSLPKQLLFVHLSKMPAGNAWREEPGRLGHGAGDSGFQVTSLVSPGASDAVVSIPGTIFWLVHEL